MAVIPEDRTLSYTHSTDECAACEEAHENLRVIRYKLSPEIAYYICPTNGDPISLVVGDSGPEPEDPAPELEPDTAGDAVQVENITAEVTPTDDSVGEATEAELETGAVSD